MNETLRLMSAFVALVILLVGAGCVTESSNTTGNRPTPAANTNAASATATTSAPTPAKTGNAPPNTQPVTLPVLDAFFAQENFAAELKSKLQLTDEQVNKLRSIARQETSKLRESDNHDEYAGRTTAAREDAYEKSRAAIGEEKTQELIAFVNERWSGDVTAPTTASVTPAAAPRDAVGVPQDKRVVVNAPAFRMDLFEGGKLIKSYKIGIGYPEFPLPTGLRKADTIIFNPTWTPPDEPWVESPGSKVKVGERIEAGDKLNPLGPIKIPIGLPSLIHGGKAPAKLGGFASHGCVGLTSAQIQDFAKRLAQLGGTEISDEQIAEYQKNKTETKPVKLSKAVPVELRYETITVEDGKLHIYRDVYDRGTNTEENLRNVLQSYGVTLDQLSDSKRAEVTRALGQMARDAGGKPVPDATATNKSDSAKGNSSAAPSTSSSSRKGDKSREESKANNVASGKVTRTIKGGKEVVVAIPALLGKGYPGPVDLNAGVASKKAAPRSRRRR
ncbi:MAG: L,D-transpeptidase [Acidobacteriota bacterium]